MALYDAGHLGFGVNVNMIEVNSLRKIVAERVHCYTHGPHWRLWDHTCTTLLDELNHGPPSGMLVDEPMRLRL